MLRRPHNISKEKWETIYQKDWEKLSKAWDARKNDVYKRFAEFPIKVPEQKIDTIMAELLGVYYRTELNVEPETSWEQQLKDELNKGYWVEDQICKLQNTYPELNTKMEVRFDNTKREGTAADYCMGGIVKAFIEMTHEVCKEHFGKPYKDKPQALRNGIPERSSWDAIKKDYITKGRQYREALKIDSDAPPPQIFRQ